MTAPPFFRDEPSVRTSLTEKSKRSQVMSQAHLVFLADDDRNQKTGICLALREGLIYLSPTIREVSRVRHLSVRDFQHTALPVRYPRDAPSMTDPPSDGARLYTSDHWQFS